MFKIGTLADWFGVGLIEGIRESERCGAEGVQLYAAGELDPLTLGKDQLKLVKDTVKGCRQQVAALCGELGGYGLEKEAEHAEKLAYLKKTLELAVELDCQVVTTHIGVVPQDKAVPRYEAMRRACHEAGEYAAKLGCRVAVETGPEEIGTLKAFIEACETKGMAINYDPANIVMLNGRDEVQGVYTAGGLIVHTHAKDGVSLESVDVEEYYHNFAEGGLDWARGVNTCKETPLGEGSVRWGEYLKTLRDVGYGGFLTIEREVTNGAADIRMAVGFLRGAIAKL